MLNPERGCLSFWLFARDGHNDEIELAFPEHAHQFGRAVGILKRRVEAVIL